MTTKTFGMYESSPRSYCRHSPVVFNRAKGAFMYDEEGNRYLDFLCGAGALNYGHNNDYIKEKLVSYLQNDGVLHALDLHTPAKREFLDTLEEKILKPRGLN